MKIIIYDDQVSEMEDLMQRCREYLDYRGMEAELRGINNSVELQREKPDILILDVEMPGEDGIAIKDRLAKTADGPLIIFATNYRDAVSKAFNRNVIGFLVKPVTLNELTTLMDTAVAYLTIDKVVTFDDGSFASTKDIVWITANKGYSDFQLVNGKVKDGGKRSLKVWEQELAVCGLIRIEEGLLINARYVKTYKEGWVTMPNSAKKSVDESDTVMFEISRRRRKECHEKYISFCNKIAKYI
ncbi:MAG: response regulator [Muribaculaceae bacterium]